MRHELRDRRTGQYRATPPCDACGKPRGEWFYTDDEVCRGSDGPGFHLCARVRCAARYADQPVEVRRAFFAAQRAKNDARRRGR